MILLKLFSKKDKEVVIKRCGIRSWKHVLSLDTIQGSLYLSWEVYWRYEKSEAPLDWRVAYTPASISFGPFDWQLNRTRFIHDGCYHILRLGPFGFYRFHGGEHCEEIGD